MMMTDVDETFRPIHELDLCSPPSEDPVRPTSAPTITYMCFNFCGRFNNILIFKKKVFPAILQMFSICKPTKMPLFVYYYYYYYYGYGY